MSIIAQAWKGFRSNKNFRRQFILTLTVLACIGIFIPHFFEFIQQRNGKVLNDPLLNRLSPRDFSSLTFTLIYGAMITALIILIHFPFLLLKTIQAYCLLTVARMI